MDSEGRTMTSWLTGKLLVIGKHICLPQPNLCPSTNPSFSLCDLAVLATSVATHATEIFAPDSCFWLDPFPGYVVDSQDLKHLTHVNVDECKKACEEEKTFNCFSFDYRESTDECWLQRVDRFSIRIRSSAPFTYYERSCRGQSCGHP